MKIGMLLAALVPFLVRQSHNYVLPDFFSQQHLAITSYPDSPARLSSQCQLKPPLFLSDYIKANQTDKARELSRVNLPGIVDQPGSYAGFITVNESDSSNIFFWLFEGTNNSISRPPENRLIIWLQGGPGASSLFGLFVENGPYFVDKNQTLHRRVVSWTDLGSVLYIDNPVGTGFSFTSSDNGYSRNEIQIGWNLYNFLIQFYQIYPHYANTPLYIAGESYAGKYVPAFAYRIYEQNKQLHAAPVIPLHGMAIGNGWTDPENMIDSSAPLMYNFGMADRMEVEHVQKVVQRVKRLIRSGHLLDAFYENDQLFDGVLPKDMPTYMHDITGSNYFYNILQYHAPVDEAYFLPYIQSCDVRNAIHVGNTTFNVDDKVERFLLADVLDTVRHWLPTLFDSYRTLFYNGQLDIAVGVPLTTNALRQLDGWTWRREYLDATKLIWKVNDGDAEVAGYIKSVRNGKFVQAVVRNSGHLVPRDQPLRCFDLLRRFLNNNFSNM